jgi:hypothetical protein
MNDELRRELESRSTFDLEQIAGDHFMFSDSCLPEIRSRVRNRQIIACEILENRKVDTTNTPDPTKERKGRAMGPV